MTPDLTPLPTQTKWDRCPLCGKQHTPDEPPPDDVPLSWVALAVVITAFGLTVAAVSLSHTFGFRL